jgi:4-amino-4-deoxy-L-arabinose transferase-like glycosyltransferase
LERSLRQIAVVPAALLAALLAAFLAVGGLLAACASYVPYTLLFGATIGSGTDDQLLRGAGALAAAYPQMVWRLRLCSVAFLVAAALAMVFRRKLQIWIGEALLPIPRFLDEIPRSLIRRVKTEDKLDLAVVSFLFFAGIAVRIRFLLRPIRFDEADSFLSFVSKPLYIGLSYYPEPNNHLLHTFLSHFAWQVFGDHEWALRMPALLFGSLLIPATYCAGRVLYGRGAALIAAALVAGSSPLINYSVEARGYIILCVLFLLLVVTSRYLLDHDSPSAWLVWGLIAALGLYTIPTMLYGVVSMAVWIALSSVGIKAEELVRRLRRLTIAVVFAGILTCLLYLPVLLASGPSALLSNRYVRPISLSYVLAQLPGEISQTWRAWTADVPSVLTLLLGASFLVAILCHRRISTCRVPPVAAALAVFPLLLIQRVLPFTRVWTLFLPLCAMTSAAGLWLLVSLLTGRWKVASFRISLLLAVTLFVLMGRSDWRSSSLSSDNVDGVERAARWMKSYMRPADTVVAFETTRAPLKYYFRRHAVERLSHPLPCRGMTLEAFTSTSSASHRRVVGTRTLIITTTGRASFSPVVAECVSGPNAPSGQLVYQQAGITVVELN